MTQPTPTPDLDHRPSRSNIIPLMTLRFTRPFIWGIFMPAIILLFWFLPDMLWPTPRSPYGWTFWGALAGAGIGNFGLALLGTLLLLSILIVLTLLFRIVRRRRSAAVISYVNQAVRLNLPLPAFLGAAARSETGKLHRRLTILQGQLAFGLPLASSLARTVPEISARSIALVAAGENTGQLSASLSELVAEDLRSREPGFDRRAFIMLYPIILLVVLGILVIGLTIFVVPKFHEIFNDFRVSMPYPLQWVVSVPMSYGDPWGVVLFCILALILIVFTGSLIGEIILPYQWSSARRNFFKDFLLWHTPFARALAQNRGLADTLTVLADSSRAGVPLPSALRQASGLDINLMLARRIQALELAVHRGTPLPEAARLARLPNLVSGMWATAQASASLPQSCDFLARYYRSRFYRTAIFLRASIEPLLVFIMGILVAMVALTIFTSLVRLIYVSGDMWSIQ